MKELYTIKKYDSHKKVNGKLEHDGMGNTKIIKVLEADNRSQAWALYSYYTGLGKGYNENLVILTATRNNHNKKRRVERLTVRKLNVTKEQLEKVNNLMYIGCHEIRRKDGKAYQIF